MPTAPAATGGGPTTPDMAAAAATAAAALAGTAQTVPADAATIAAVAAQSAPAADVATAVATLQSSLASLQAAIQALSGATQVTGGGAPAQTPTQAPAPAPPPAADPAADVRQRIVSIAQAEVAKEVKETRKDTDSAGNIVRYRSAVTGPGENPDLAEPWCADFASWVSKEAGAPIGIDGRGEDYTVALLKWAKEHDRWRPREGSDPKPGDLVMIDWQGGQDVDHVAIVEKVEDGRVHTIGGNESNRVKRASYAVGDAKMMGFITPAGA